MAFKILVRTREQSSTSGTGAITVSGLVSTDNVRFSDVMSVGDTAFMCVVSGDGIGWEEFLGTYSSANTITRTTTITNHLGTTAHVSLTGTSRVFGIIPSDISGLLDNVFGNTRGSLLIRGSSGWTSLVPGTSGYVLKSNGSGSDPAYSASNGFLTAAMTDIPTIANTGFSTWLNQGTATISDSSVGLCLADLGTPGLQIRMRYKAAPSTPYTMTAGFTVLGAGNGDYCGLGFYNGTDKLHVFGLNYFSGWSFLVGKFNSVTSYNSNDTSAGGQNSPLLNFIRIGDDGTNVTFDFSADGVNFMNIQTTAKSAAWLGSSGYTNVGFFIVPQSSKLIGTLVSFQ